MAPLIPDVEPAAPIERRLGVFVALALAAHAVVWGLLVSPGALLTPTMPFSAIARGRLSRATPICSRRRLVCSSLRGCRALAWPLVLLVMRAGSRGGQRS